MPSRNIAFCKGIEFPEKQLPNPASRDQVRKERRILEIWTPLTPSLCFEASLFNCLAPSPKHVDIDLDYLTSFTSSTSTLAPPYRPLPNMACPDLERGSCPPSPISDHDEKDPEARPACFKSTLQECLFVLSVTMAVAMTSVLTGSITVMSSFAAKDLNMTNAQITWMNAACSLSAGALLLFFGSIADLFGRKSLFIGSMALFSIVTLGTGFAKDGITIDVLCGILGIFSASVVPPAQGMLGTIYGRPSRRKNRAFGCFSAGNPLGFVFGTILSGLFTQVFNWRAGFYFIAITYFITSIVAFLTVPTDTMPKQKLDAETLKKLDLPGTGMTIAGIGMFCAGLSLAGDAPHGWKTSYVLVLLILGLFLIGAFIVWELKYPYAIVDMNVFKDRDFSLVSSAGGLQHARPFADLYV